MRVYLSGPMRGLEDFNYKKFHALAAELRSQGHEVFNPAETFGGDQTRKPKEYLRVDAEELSRALPDGESYYEALVVMDGWENSKGVAFEMAVATGYEIPILDVYTFQKLKIPETILQEAQRIVHGDRNQDYGHPYHDFSRTAKIWSAILGVEVTPRQVSLCQIGVKISRECNRPKRDNRVDICGYAETLDMVDQYEKQLARAS